MKFVRTSIVSAVLALTLLAGAALAQGPHSRGGGLFGLGDLADVLDLTDAQQTQIKQIFESGKTTMKPLFQQEQQSHQAMMQLITSGKFDQAAAQTIANQEAQVHSQLEVQHAQLAAQAYQVLTAQQKTQLTQILAKREQRMQEREQQNSQATPQP